MINEQNLRNLVIANRESRYDLNMNAFAKRDICGTSHCVLGNYAARQDLQQSFALRYKTTRGITTGWLYRADTDSGAIDYGSPIVQYHFGISKRECDELFGPGREVDEKCSNAQEAADYIERFIERKLKEERKGQS